MVTAVGSMKAGVGLVQTHRTVAGAAQFARGRTSIDVAGGLFPIELSQCGGRKTATAPKAPSAENLACGGVQMSLPATRV